MKGTLLTLAFALLGAGSAVAQDTTHKAAPAHMAAPARAAAPAARASAPVATRTAAAAAPKFSVDDIKAAQAGLSKAKVYTGQQTGRIDAATRRAIRDFQRAHKMPITGTLNDSLLTRLKAQQ